MNPSVLISPHPHVIMNPSLLGGSPFIRGSRVLVRRVYQFWLAGTPFAAIAKRYPQVRPAALLDALSFAMDNADLIAADMEQEQKLLGGRPS